MKTMKFLSSVLALGLIMLFTQVQAQNVGIAADKQKQANLEKNKKRQAELKQKFNSMTPEQQAEMKRKADQYKRNGGKINPGTGTKPTTTTNQNTTPKTSGNPALQSKPASEPAQQGTAAKKIHSGKPYWAEQHGQKKENATAEPVKTGNKVAVSEKLKNSTRTTTKVTPKPSVKVVKAAEKAPADKPKK
ncbi:MAG: hypothetical protein HXX13_07180 [Bacteroidetes bacterium]|nr:hypothetical protein [Bacteroidota bacterium]